MCAALYINSKSSSELWYRIQSDFEFCRYPTFLFLCYFLTAMLPFLISNQDPLFEGSADFLGIKPLLGI